MAGFELFVGKRIMQPASKCSVCNGPHFANMCPTLYEPTKPGFSSGGGGGGGGHSHDEDDEKLTQTPQQLAQAQVQLQQQLQGLGLVRGPQQA